MVLFMEFLRLSKHALETLEIVYFLQRVISPDATKLFLAGERMTLSTKIQLHGDHQPLLHLCSEDKKLSERYKHLVPLPEAGEGLPKAIPTRDDKCRKGNDCRSFLFPRHFFKKCQTHSKGTLLSH